MKLILLNGPPRSGKDHATKLLLEKLDQVTHLERFSRPNKEAFAAMMFVPIDNLFRVDVFESNKEEMIPLLGVSYRQWQIDFSEKFMKPLYGNAIFGKLLFSRLEEVPKMYPFEDYGEVVVLVPDCGFQIEVNVVVNELPPEDILLIRLDRDSCSFAGDSRERVEPTNGIRTIDIKNDGTPLFEQQVLDAVNDFFSKKA